MYRFDEPYLEMTDEISRNNEDATTVKTNIR